MDMRCAIIILLYFRVSVIYWVHDTCKPSHGQQLRHWGRTQNVKTGFIEQEVRFPKWLLPQLLVARSPSLINGHCPFWVAWNIHSVFWEKTRISNLGKSGMECSMISWLLCQCLVLHFIFVLWWLTLDPWGDTEMNSTADVHLSPSVPWKSLNASN